MVTSEHVACPFCRRRMDGVSLDFLGSEISFDSQDLLELEIGFYLFLKDIQHSEIMGQEDKELAQRILSKNSGNLFSMELMSTIVNLVRMYPLASSLWFQHVLSIQLIDVPSDSISNVALALLGAWVEECCKKAEQIRPLRRESDGFQIEKIQRFVMSFILSILILTLSIPSVKDTLPDEAKEFFGILIAISY